MKGFVDDIEGLTERNADFRRVLYSGKRLQLVLMALQPGEDIGDEVHTDRDQFFRVEEGRGEVWIRRAQDCDQGRLRDSGSGRGPAQREEHRQDTAEAAHPLRATRARRRHGAGHQGRCHGVEGALRGTDH